MPNVNNFVYDHAGLVLTEGFEGLRLVGYPDVRGVPTNGYGHTGPDVYIGQIIEQAQAEAWLASDIAWAAQAVNDMVTVPIDQNQFDALVDFVFNDGAQAFKTSHLLIFINENNFAAAEDQFMLWVNSGGKRFDGLVRRRTAEVALFKQ